MTRARCSRAACLRTQLVPRLLLAGRQGGAAWRSDRQIVKQLGRHDGRGAQLPDTARTLCTPCALCGHACRLTCLHVVPMRRRVRAAGGPGEQKCSPGDCRPVRPGAACCIATHGAPWAREVRALGPWHGLESVGIGLRGVIFFAKNVCTCMEMALFSLARAEVALAKKLSLCTPCALRGLCAGVLCKLACICVVHTPLAGRAWQAGLESKSDLWVICIQEIQARAAESVRSARCAPVKLYECSVSILCSVAGKRVRSVDLGTGISL